MPLFQCGGRLGGFAAFCGGVPLWLAAAAAVLAGDAARADIDPLSGIDFVRIGAVGNGPWPGTVPATVGDRAVGRGGVGYEYNIGRFEFTTAQAVEFFNAAFDRPANDRLPHLIPPNFWGAASATPTTPGGQRWRVPAGSEMLPVGNLSWRMAAMICNWYHNGKALGREAFLNGAYDVSTFSYTGTVFNDQFTYNVGARYWIPTWDEWLKSAHFDPNKNGQGQGGWWVYPNASDTPLVYGPPGVLVNGVAAQANAGWDGNDFPGHNPFGMRLGAYGNVTSAFGLFDLAGATTEWTEGISLTNGVFPTGRLFEGSAWVFGDVLSDQVQYRGSDFPSLSTFDLGFRLASSIPAPSHAAIVGSGMLLLRRTRRPWTTRHDPNPRCVRFAFQSFHRDERVCATVDDSRHQERCDPSTGLPRRPRHHHRCRYGERNVSAQDLRP